MISKTNNLFESFNNYKNITKPQKLLKEDAANDADNIKLYMNTWANYNVNGADIQDGGWMSIEQAKQFLEKHKDEEPFINDTDNVPGDFGIDEYTNPWQAIENLEYLENCDDKDAFIAILEDQGSSNLQYAKEVYESGDYTFFPGVSNDEELGEAYVDLVGGLEGVNNIENYIDEDKYRESWREAAEQSVREEYPDLDEDSEEFEAKVEEDLDNEAQEQLEIDLRDGADLSDYFDYEALGRDLDFEGYFFASTGAIQTN